MQEIYILIIRQATDYPIRFTKYFVAPLKHVLCSFQFIYKRTQFVTEIHVLPVAY